MVYKAYSYLDPSVIAGPKSEDMISVSSETFVERMISGVRDRRRPEYREGKSGGNQVEKNRYALDI